MPTLSFDIAPEDLERMEFARPGVNHLETLRGMCAHYVQQLRDIAAEKAHLEQQRTLPADQQMASVREAQRQEAQRLADAQAELDAVRAQIAAEQAKASPAVPAPSAEERAAAQAELDAVLGL